MTGVKLAFKPSFGSFSTCGECHTSRCSVSGIEMAGELLYNERLRPFVYAGFGRINKACFFNFTSIQRGYSGEK